MENVTFSGYVPGAIGRITEIHALYYKEHWDFELFFESKVASEMSEFLNRFDARRDGFWVARVDGKIVGSVAIDGKKSDRRGARLRFFITDPEYQGQGIGRRLLRKAVNFCRKAKIKRIYLYTFAGLDAARHLYEQSGFVLCKEMEEATWGRTVTEQEFELMLHDKRDRTC